MGSPRAGRPRALVGHRRHRCRAPRGQRPRGARRPGPRRPRPRLHDRDDRDRPPGAQGPRGPRARRSGLPLRAATHPGRHDRRAHARGPRRHARRPRPALARSSRTPAPRTSRPCDAPSTTWPTGCRRCDPRRARRARRAPGRSTAVGALPLDRAPSYAGRRDAALGRAPRWPPSSPRSVPGCRW